MRPWDPLNERQLGMLRRIGDGTDVVSNAGPSLALTVYALRARGLVTTPAQAGWPRAEITDAGRFYLGHGHHPRRPDRPSRRERNKNPAKQAGVAPADLLGMVQTAGGSLTIPDPAPAVRAAWRRAVYAARRSEAPEAAMLMYTGRDNGDLRIWLPSHARSGTTQAEASPSVLPAVQVPKSPAVKVAEHLPASPHPVVVLVRDSPNLIQVTSGLLPRVLVILQAIADETGRRGYDLIVDSTRGHHGLAVDAGGLRCELRIKETNEYRTDQHPPARGNLHRRPDRVPSGRLQLSLGTHGRTWADGKRSQLEDRLGEIFAELDTKVAAYRARRARQQREQTERRARWEKAMSAARHSFTYAYRRDYILAQHNAWRLADSLRQFCAVIDPAFTAPDPESWQRAGKTWTAWLTRYADSIDPARMPEAFASFAFDPQPAPDDLEPYLDGWNPHGPEAGYRQPD